MSEKFWYARATVKNTEPRQVLCVKCDSFDRALYIKERMRANMLLCQALVLDTLPRKRNNARLMKIRVLTVQEYERMVTP